MSSTTVVEWVIDTQPLWPEAQRTKDLEIHAARALSLLPPSQAVAVLKHYHCRDAKLSLVSHLAKRFAISYLLRIPWSASIPQLDSKGKPSFPGISFNVSHQDGIVALVAVCRYHPSGVVPGEHVDVGIDVVSTAERRERDRKIIANNGSFSIGNDWGGSNGSNSTNKPDSLNDRANFRKFVSIHGEVLGNEEINILLSDAVIARCHNGSQEGMPLGMDLADARLRAFYTLWCLREAYVKMTGDALLAPWLADLNFSGWQAPRPNGTRNFEAPPPIMIEREDEMKEEENGFTPDIAETALFQPIVCLCGEKVQDTNIVLRSLGRSIMVCTTLRTPNRKADGMAWRLGQYRLLDVRMILDHADRNP